MTFLPETATNNFLALPRSQSLVSVLYFVMPFFKFQWPDV